MWKGTGLEESVRDRGSKGTRLGEGLQGCVSSRTEGICALVLSTPGRTTVEGNTRVDTAVAIHTRAWATAKSGKLLGAGRVKAGTDRSAATRVCILLAVVALLLLLPGSTANWEGSVGLLHDGSCRQLLKVNLELMITWWLVLVFNVIQL